MGYEISDISYIIGFRESGSERLEALLFVLGRLRTAFPELEIQVVEQDIESSLTLTPELNILHHFAFNPGMFNRSWGFNVGAELTSKTVLVFADADVFLEQEGLLACLHTVSKFGAATPNAVEVSNVKLSSESALGHVELDKRPLFTFAGGMLAMTRAAFVKTGGWDERFEGWGGEDTAMSHVTCERCSFHMLNLPFFHIDHPRTVLDGNQHKGYLENKRLAEEIQLLHGQALERYVGHLAGSARGNIEKYRSVQAAPVAESASTPHLKFVLAVTTFNRLAYLKACLESFFQTRSDAASWKLVIADDGSTDGTVDYLKGLQSKHDIKVVFNQGRKVHHQVNSILRTLSEESFDMCFRCDDDVLFLQVGWDTLYWNTAQSTGFSHLVFYDKKWRPLTNLDRPHTYANLESNCHPEKVQGAFYTLTPEIIREVGYFDTLSFGAKGLGHVDYSHRCSRLGFNRIDFVFDARNSNEYLKLQESAHYSAATSAREKSKGNSQRELEMKMTAIRSPRGHVPFNETATRLNGQSILALEQKKSNTGKTGHFRKADTTYYPRRGLTGLVGLGLKKAFNFSLKRKWYFFPRAIKGLGRVLNKISIDLIHIDD